LASDVEWQQLLGLAGWEEAELLSRYQGVVCLAVAPESHYNLGNAARHESFAEATQRHGATWAAWRDAAQRCDARADRQHADDFAAEFDLSGASRSSGSSGSSGGRHRAPSPELIANPQDAFPAAAFAAGPADANSALLSPFDAKVAALRACVEATLLSHAGAYTGSSAESSSSSAAGLGRCHQRRSTNAAGRWSMPVDFIVAQAHAVATSAYLGSGSGSSGSSVYLRSVALLRDVQSARRGDSQRRKDLTAAHQRDAAQRLFQL
jgi:hypothetical protein